MNIEYKSEDDLIAFVSKWEKWCPENMPEAISRHMVKTGPKSSLLMAVYESEAIAEDAGMVAETFLNGAHHIHDMIAFDGEVLM